MKKFFSLVTLLVMLVTTGGGVHAQTTYEISNNSDTKPSKNDVSPWTFVSNNKTFTITYTDKEGSTKKYAQGDDKKLSGGFKCSNGYVYTLTIPSDLSISQIKFTGYSNENSASSYLEYNGDAKTSDIFMGKSVSNFEVKEYIYVWPENSKSITFKPCNKETVLTITLIEAASNKLKAPTISYTDAGLVTITAGEGTSPKEIRYTTDGTDPSATAGEVYSAPFSAPGKTVKAIAIANDESTENSDIVTVAVPNAVASTTVTLTKVTVNGIALTTEELNTFVNSKTYTHTGTYKVAPTVVFTKTTTKKYTDNTTSEESTDETATVVKGDDSFTASTTIGEDTYTITFTLDKTKEITADVASFDLSVKRAEIAKKEIKLTARNTSGTLSITKPDAVTYSLSKTATDGESVTVSDGETVTMTVCYQSDVAVAKTSDKITVAVGETSLEIPFTYEDTEDMITTCDKVTGDMSWDFTTAATADVTTSGRTTLVPFANKKESFADGFKYEYLWEKNAVYLYRKNNTCFQGTELGFTTTVPGTVEVVFSNTGSNTARTAKIGGNICEETGSATGSTKVTATGHVNAGDVSIVGWQLKEEKNNAIRIYSIKFTADQTTNITIGENKMATYANTSAWTVPADFEVYTAKYADNKVKLSQVEAGKVIKAGEGVVLYGEAKTYTVNLSTETGEKLDNSLVGVTVDTQISNNTTYVLVKGTSGICFGRLQSGETVKAGKAYLTIENVNAAKTISVDFGTTGINTIENTADTANGAYYTLSGQRTVKPVKGMYIHNGKKYIAK